jgi:lipoate-protein ligase A
MAKKWKVTVSSSLAPSLNMALDQILWEKAKNEPDTVFLRFYSWEPPGISLGANQKSSELVNTEYCQQEGIEVVRRITGGSAIFHDKELTYSFATVNDAMFPGAIRSYERICGALLETLQDLGIEAEFRGVSMGIEPSFSNQDCFSLTSRHDIVVNNRKLIGNAQRKDKSSFLQHGSILINIEQSLWREVFLLEPQFDRIIALSDLGITTNIDSLAKSCIQGFEEYFVVECTPFSFSKEEMARARELAPSYTLPSS